MSGQANAGLGAARGLLALLEENTTEDFEAAEEILGAQPELVDILRMLRKFKEHEAEPLDRKQLRDIVRRELLAYHLPVAEMAKIARKCRVPLNPVPSTTPDALERYVDLVMRFIDVEIESPNLQVDALTTLLVEGARRAGPEHLARTHAMLRELSIQALSENVVMFATLHSLSQLGARIMGGNPIPYKHDDSRRRLVTRLVREVEDHDPDLAVDAVRALLNEGLRGPADAQIAAVRRMKPKRAHGG